MKHVILIASLFISMIFFYLLISDKSIVWSFTKTQFEEEWNFIVLGDTQQQYTSRGYELGHYPSDNTSNPIRRAIFNNIVEKNPKLELIVHTGDVCASGGEQNDWDRYYEDIENVTKNNISVY
ncbi:MAG: hypothetical protein ACFE9L_14915 [Candidatus Hodarchaeota archaeon]